MDKDATDKNSDGFVTPKALEKVVYPKTIMDLGLCAAGLNLFEKKLKSEEALEHCKFGLGRRLFTLRNCLKRILDISPPTRTKILNDTEKADLTAHLHCFFINNSGAFNNLAWIWYYEKLSDENKNNFPFFKISLFNKDFQKYMPAELIEKCRSFSSWYEYLKDYRDPLAHKIPFYIIPYNITTENQPKYKELVEQLNLESNLLKREEIMSQMDGLGIYTGSLMGSFKDGQVLNLHQVVTDAITLLDLIKTYQVVFNKEMAIVKPKAKGVDINTTMQLVQHDIQVASVNYNLLFKLINGLKKTGQYKRFEELFFYIEQAIIDQFIFSLAKVFSINNDESLIKFINLACNTSDEIFESRISRYPTAPHRNLRNTRVAFIKSKEHYIKRIKSIEAKINPLRNTQRAHNYPLRKKGKSTKWNEAKRWLNFAEAILFRAAKTAGLSSYSPGNFFPKEINFRMEDLINCCKDLDQNVDTRERRTDQVTARRQVKS